jgi:hypothetical protein
MYFWPGKARGMKLHLRPVGKPAPPRPRSADFFISATTASGGICSATIFLSAWYPPRASKSFSRQFVPVTPFMMSASGP